ncbi:lactonase family protein [bacterium]
MKINILILIIFISGTSVHGNVLNVYFGTGGTTAKGIYHATFDPETGKLSDAKLAAQLNNPGFLALHPDKQKLYAVGQLEGRAVVAGYQINPSGVLTQFTVSSIPDGTGTHLAVHPSGKFLLTAQYGGGSTALFPLDRDGKLGTSMAIEHEGGSNVVPGRQDKPHPHWCGYSPEGQYALIPDLGLDGIVIYHADQDKPAISYHGFAAAIPGGGPRHMRFSVDGKFIYLLNELTVSVTTFAYNSETGTAVRMSTTPALTEEVKDKEGFNSAAEILVHPNGRFVYSSNRGHDSITSYLADPATGHLTVTEVESIRGAWPRNINLDGSGRWLLAAGAHSNTISVFAIDQSSGELTFQPKSIINVPGPICILFVE